MGFALFNFMKIVPPTLHLRFPIFTGGDKSDQLAYQHDSLNGHGKMIAYKSGFHSVSLFKGKDDFPPTTALTQSQKVAFP